MSVIGNALLLGGDAGAPSFTTERSVRLRSSASAYFNRTPATTTNQSLWTFSCWLKRGAFTNVSLWSAGIATTSYSDFGFSSDKLYWYNQQGGVDKGQIYTASVLRDPSAWYHLVFVFNGTAPSVTFYVNGIEQTKTVTTSQAVAASYQNSNTAVHTLGRNNPNASQYFDGYLTEINFIDGQALTPSAFGEYDAVRNTQWKPKAYSGSWGTNGFYLKFANPASIGLDSSGNGNNWTANNIQTSNSALTTYDSMLDVPTLTSESASNFTVLNPLSGANLGSGNLQVTGSGAGDPHTSTIAIPEAGKWYCEMSSTAYNASTIVGWFGVANRLGGNFSGLLSRVTGAGAGFFTNDVVTTSTNIGALNDVFGVAVDRDAGVVKIYINNVLQASTPTIATGVDLFFYYGTYTSGTGWVNFGQRPFAYTPPTGFKALNTYNLPDGAVTSSDDYHKVYTYTGNGGGLQVGEIQKPLSLYNLDRSLRFKGTNSYFDKVFASGGANTKGTLSMWVKRGKLAVQQELVRFGTTGTLFSGLLFNASDQLAFLRLNSTYQVNLVTTRVFRDPNAWYHIVVAWDSTLGSSSNSVKIYINGIQETVFTSSTYPSASLDMYFFTAGTHNIGRYPVGGNYFGGYMAEFHAVDGTQLTANDFGQFDGNYYWTPKDYTGGYGTNGWHLDFEDFSSISATGIGKDVSGNGNNFTPYNFNVTTPADTNVNWDSMVDVPTLTSADVANFCVLDPIAPDKNISGTGGVYSDGNLKIAANGAASDAIVATGNLGCANGKFYAEVTCITAGSGGAQTTYAAVNIFGYGSAVYLAYDKSGQYYNGTAWTAGWSSWTANDTIGISIDQTVTPTSVSFYKNGTLQGTLTTISTSNLTFAVRAAYAASFAYNFGQRPFRYTPPTGFKSLNSFNVAEVTGDLESPDFVWIKSRSAATGHALFNSVTGVGKYLSSNATTAETTDVNSLIQFNKNGFLLGNAAIVNTSAATYVASAWKSGSTTVTNTDGSISSQVSANPSAGFSIVTLTKTASSNETFGHGLGIAPKFVIVKSRGSSSWNCWFTGFAGTEYISLDLTAAKATLATLWNSTVPSSTVFSMGTAWGAGNYVAYCFSEIAGYSKFGSYTGNGSTDGPFVYLGFRPRWVMYKRIDAAGYSWAIWDTSRDTSNVVDLYLWANSSQAETSFAALDIVSNGFKLRTADAGNNGSGATYIYAAFAEHPFKYSLAR